ncbi:hypothetical protein BDB00DRAFT_826181 [Zychaea mexicana]|uniref:uncharacterized protein n=1 Tax=Zychaea mexicana TaxID=64656 RepID=UPI0022FE3370|nr:uncharacterized protein BDB00DRAFT_826181 [Zychaea mexicana]KAI9492925.1 hypothetical protein BDB00DRAFT_826181 [Zychaea mexicana]
MTGKGVVRSIKNYAKGFSDVQRKVREATSNDPWGPSGTLMNEIAQLTFNQHDFIEIMDMIDKRLNDKGKNWRHVFKALLLLDYCLHVGSENVVLYAKENIYVIKTLKEFQHVDDNGRDVGANVRQKAKDITNLLTDDARLKDERRQRQQMRDRMAGVNDYMNDAMGIRPGPNDFGGSSRGPQGDPQNGGPRGDNEDRELQRALEESRRMAEAEDKKRREKEGDEDLAKAIRLSEQEAQEKERKQKEKLERENQEKLFGNNNSNNNSQAASFNPFPQNQSFDASLNPYQQQPQQQQQQQWPQMTGMTNMTFGDPIAAGNPQLAFQNTGMMNNPYQQQQQQQQLQNNPYQQLSSGGGFAGGLQAQMTGLPQQSQMTGLAPFQTSTVTGFQQPQMTAASNNPFGQFGSASQTSQPSAAFGSTTFGQTLSASPTITSSSLANRSPSLSAANINANPSAAGQSRSFSFPSSPSMQPTGTQASSSPAGDGRYAKLNQLLANKDDGMDTFGNTGNLRFPMGSGYANSIKPEFTGAPNGNTSSSTGDLLNIGNNGNQTQDTSNTQSSFADSFGQQASRNPFGQPSPSLAAATPKTNNQKSLLELMQEQKQQQQQQSLQIPQMGMQQPQMTGMQQPQMTGMQPQMTGMAFGGQQPQQQQSSPFLQQPQVTGFNNGFGQQAHNQQTGSLF